MKKIISKVIKITVEPKLAYGNMVCAFSRTNSFLKNACLVFKSFRYVMVSVNCYSLGSAIKNLGLFSKSPGDLRMEKMDF